GFENFRPTDWPKGKCFMTQEQVDTRVAYWKQHIRRCGIQGEALPGNFTTDGVENVDVEDKRDLEADESDDTEDSDDEPRRSNLTAADFAED
ncbi:MAG TPA: hypothetical protein VHZ30_01080, partial [Verrucomicrobiae bacterium]|nr:hypothetical protein [Verrucomicrobiae bacterium]